MKLSAETVNFKRRLAMVTRVTSEGVRRFVKVESHYTALNSKFVHLECDCNPRQWKVSSQSGTKPAFGVVERIRSLDKNAKVQLVSLFN